MNEASLGSGGPVKTNVNPTSPQYLQPLRSALFKGDYAEANDLAIGHPVLSLIKRIVKDKSVKSR